jgi:hypothetical protein
MDLNLRGVEPQGESVHQLVDFPSVPTNTRFRTNCVGENNNPGEISHNKYYVPGQR